MNGKILKGRIVDVEAGDATTIEELAELKEEDM